MLFKIGVSPYVFSGKDLICVLCEQKEFLFENIFWPSHTGPSTNPFSYLTILSHNILKPSTMTEEELDAYLDLVEFGITRNQFDD